MASVISCGNQSLPRSIDVNVTTSKRQVESTTDLSTTVFVSNDAPFLHGTERIRYYDSEESLQNDFVSTTEAFKAGRDFFSQPVRSKTLAVARAFSTNQSAYLVTGEVDVTALIALNNGGFDITVDGVLKQVTGLDFTSDTTLANIAATIQANAEMTGTTVTVHNEKQLLIKTNTAGSAGSITVLDAPTGAGTPTNISGAGFLNGDASEGKVTPGYDFVSFIDELNLIAEAATCSGKFVYAYTLDAFYRDKTTPENFQLNAAAWMETRTGILGITSNNILAKDAGSTADIGSNLKTNGYIRTFANYHNNPSYYPEVSILALMLSVDYAAAKSTLTAKFKDLPGIPTIPITVTDLTVLENKRYNVFTLVGNNSRTFREGEEVAASWFMDDLINLDNYKEEMQTAIAITFLRKGKVPYTVGGQAILREPIQLVSRNYVFNGTLADRPIKSTTSKSGKAILPAYDIIATPLENVTDAQRASRVGPPFTVNVQLAGAIHSISVSVNAFS